MDGILFDLNNCLVHRRDIPIAIGQAVKKAAMDAGYEFKVPKKFLTEPWLTEWGESHKLLFWRFLHLCKVETKYREELARRCEELYQAGKDYSMVQLYPDTKYLFDLDVPTGLITNSSPETTAKILSATGLKFDHIFANGGEENLMKAAKEQMGDILFVGDSTDDICLGRQHELKTIAINRGIVPLGRLLRARPDLILNSLSPLPYISKLYSKPKK